MKNWLIYKEYLLMISKDKDIKLSVKGTSMFPVLLENDQIIVSNSDFYEIGSILVFFHGNEDLLVHRLLCKSNGDYFCKGDNSFRLEQIKKENIVGEVVGIERHGEVLTLGLPNHEFLSYSFKIYKEFMKNKCDIDLTKNSQIYKEYRDKYLKKKVL